MTDGGKKMYYGGAWHDAIDGEYFDDLEPFSGSVFAKVAAGGPKDMAAAIQAAADAFPAWAQTTPSERAQLLQNAADIVKRRRDEIAELSARETGSTVPYSAFQQDLVANTRQEQLGDAVLRLLARATCAAAHGVARAVWVELVEDGAELVFGAAL
jgi:acyl-CoA reductase-like NAD-dependent aldehyde dehydrogenase